MKVDRLLLALALLLPAAFLFGAEPRPYSEGPVTELTYVKIKPGMFEAYMKWLATERKPMLDEQKKAGLIVDSRIYATTARNPNEPDLVLAITYKNMAALDNLDEKTDAIMEKFFGPQQKANEAMISREQMRQILGQELIRELTLKDANANTSS